MPVSLYSPSVAIFISFFLKSAHFMGKTSHLVLIYKSLITGEGEQSSICLPTKCISPSRISLFM